MNTNLQEISCGEIMDITIVANFSTLFIQALKSGHAVVLDAQHVERADTAALQLLCAFFNDARTQQQDIQWKNPSDTLCHSAALLGLSKMLNLETYTH